MVCRGIGYTFVHVHVGCCWMCAYVYVCCVCMCVVCMCVHVQMHVTFMCEYMQVSYVSTQSGLSKT